VPYHFGGDLNISFSYNIAVAYFVHPRLDKTKIMRLIKMVEGVTSGRGSSSVVCTCKKSKKLIKASNSR
jgi:hypothetical protein